MKIKLLSDRILVKPNAIEERNSFGIIPEIKKTETKVLWLLVQR
jgi:co-chaperonin GroES (HSP10)